MKAFGQHRQEERPSTGGERRGQKGGAGGQNDRLAEALNRSPRVVAQEKLAEALARRQPRQEVVQRTTRQEDFESYLKGGEEEEEEEEKETEEKEISPSSGQQSLIRIEERPGEQLPEDRHAALTRVQEVYQDQRVRLRETIAEINRALAQLPEFIYLIDEDGQILRSDDQRSFRRFPEVRAMREVDERLEVSRMRIDQELEPLPPLIAAFEQAKAQEERALIEKKLETLGRLRPLLEQRLQAAKEKVSNALPTTRTVKAFEALKKDPVKSKALAAARDEEEKAKAPLESLASQEAEWRERARENQKILSSAGSILAAFATTREVADATLYDARSALESFPAFLKRLALQNEVLPIQQKNQERLARLIQALDDGIATYLRFNGSPEAKIYLQYGELRKEAVDLQDLLLSMPLKRILADIDAISQQVAELERQPDRLGPLLPERPELYELKQQEFKEMVARYVELERNLQQAKGVKLSGLGQLQEQLKRQAELKVALKSVDTTGDPRTTVAKLDRILEEQRLLDEEIADNPELTAAVTKAQIGSLGKKNPNYAGLIGALLASGKVFDPRNLRRELARPVGPEKYVSREMELEFLLAAASQQNAFVQVGRMRKEELVAALLERGLATTAESVGQAAEGEFEADAILYFPDGTIEAVQHKTTTSKNPLEGRIHSSKELTEPEFQRQLQDAANQLSGLTAQGSTSDIYGRIPETPPPGARRVANLRFQNVFLPDHETLQEYNAIVRSVLGGVQRTTKGPRWQFVERVILNFRDGRVVYSGLGEGRYQGSFEPSGKSNLNAYTFDLDIQ